MAIHKGGRGPGHMARVQGVATPLPLAISGTAPAAWQNAAYSFAPSASGGSGMRSFASTGSALPTGVVISPTTGALSGSPTTINNYTGIVITCTDSTGSVSLGPFAINVVAQLTISGTPATTGTQGTAYSFTPSSTGGVGTKVWSIAGTPPPGVSVNSTTGVFSGTPTMAGTSTGLIISVADDIGSVPLGSFSLAIASNLAISGTPGTATAGSSYLFTPSASGGTPPYAFTSTGTALPAWASFSGSTGAISGSNATLGTTNGVNITVTDALLSSASLGAFSLVVNSPGAAPVNVSVPVITGTAQVGQTLTASTGSWSNSAASYAYQWKVGGTNAGTNANTYVPVTGDIGSTITCTVTATNGFGSASATSSATAAVIAAATVRAVGNNLVLPISSLAVVSTRISQRLIHQSVTALTDLKLGLAKGYFTGTYLRATPNANDFIVDEISVQLVSGGTRTSIVKGGSATWTVSKWTGATSDPLVDWTDLTSLGFTIPANTPFYMFVTLRPSGGTALPAYAASGPAMLYTDEGCQNNSAAPSTFGACTDTDANHRTRLAAVVTMQATSTAPVWAIVGDSQVAYSSAGYVIADGQFADHNRGDIANTIAATYDYVNLGIGSDQWETRLLDFQMQSEILAGVTGVICEYGINSFNNKANSAETVPLGLAQRGLGYFKNLKVIYATTTPQTTSTDSWATTANQTVKSYSTLLNPSTGNYALGLTFSGLLPDPLDRHTPLHDSVATDKWAVNGTAKYAAVDGLHVARGGVTLMNAVASTWNTQLAAVPTMTAWTQPTAPLLGTGTWSGGKLTNGTMSRNDILPGQAVFSIIFKVTLGASLAGSHLVIPSSGGFNWVKTLSIGTTGALTLTNFAVGSTAASTNLLNFSAENEVMITADGTNLYLFINGTFEASLAHGGNGSTAPNFQIAALSSKNVSIREVTLWNYCRQTSGTYTPATFAGTETGCVVRWPLATDATAILGPVLPS